MRSLKRACFFGSLTVALVGIAFLSSSGFGDDEPPGQDLQSLKSSPPDTTIVELPRVSPLVPAGPFAPSLTDLKISDVVVSNTDPTLTNTDTFVDQETSISVNPTNPGEIVITAFSGSWGFPNPNAPLWHSTDGGGTWTKRFSITPPPSVPSAGSPSDQTIGYARNGILFGTFLNPITNIYTVGTTNPASPASWMWNVIAGVTQRTNFNATPNSSDQPWLLVNPHPYRPDIDNVYVAYDDFGAAGGVRTRVAVAQAVAPPNFTIDNQSGLASPLATNPGHRLAGDFVTGYVYSLYQRSIDVAPPNVKSVSYILNRSMDGGATWGLNSNPLGIVIATRQSNQAPGGKFGTVNALLGGVLHAAVDPNTGDLYYVFGDRDPATGNNRLGITRIQFAPNGTAIIGPENFVTGQVQAALPSVAVNEDGIVGVMYTTFNGFTPDNFPIFSQHFALSGDQGATFNDNILVIFVSQSRDNGDPRQRVLGDYHQLKASGGRFYGAFTANGRPFGRPFDNHDPIFFAALPDL